MAHTPETVGAAGSPSRTEGRMCILSRIARPLLAGTGLVALVMGVL
jgi:hypothetical protein